MIAIIDYGMGNLASVNNAFLKLGYETCTTSDPEEVVNADRVVLPGVGAFADAVMNLCDRGLDKAVYEVIKRNKPLLGICLGLQLLFSESEENGTNRGLDVFKGRVVKFRLPPGFKVPHMGWNEVRPVPGARLFANIPHGGYFYFVHSYYVLPEDSSSIVARSDYGLDFVCAVESGNIFATQFHPEKSGELGLKILSNFARI